MSKHRQEANQHDHDRGGPEGESRAGKTAATAGLAPFPGGASPSPDLVPRGDYLGDLMDPGILGIVAPTDSSSVAVHRAVTARLSGGDRDDRGVTADADAALATASGGAGSALPDALLHRFESSLGVDLTGVQLHTDAASAHAADAVGARAYAVGRDIHFADGQYRPDEPAGQHLLAHEVAHTVQQASGSAHPQYKLAVSSPEDAAENEADRAADAMLRGQPFAVGGGAPAALSRWKETHKSIMSTSLTVELDAVGHVFGFAGGKTNDRKTSFGDKQRTDIVLEPGEKGVVELPIAATASTDFSSAPFAISSIWKFAYANGTITLTPQQGSNDLGVTLGMGIDAAVERSEVAEIGPDKPASVVVKVDISRQVDRSAGVDGSAGVIIADVGGSAGTSASDNDHVIRTFFLDLHMPATDAPKPQKDVVKPDEKPAPHDQPPAPTVPLVPVPPYRAHKVLFPTGKATPSDAEFTKLRNWIDSTERGLGETERAYLDDGRWVLDLTASTSDDGKLEKNAGLVGERRDFVLGLLGDRVPTKKLVYRPMVMEGPGASFRAVTLTIKLGSEQKAARDHADEVAAEKAMPGGYVRGDYGGTRGSVDMLPE
jgi:hypothetical protein